jgi:hypothetical protein
MVYFEREEKAGGRTKTKELEKQIFCIMMIHTS